MGGGKHSLSPWGKKVRGIPPSPTKLRPWRSALCAIKYWFPRLRSSDLASSLFCYCIYIEIPNLLKVNVRWYQGRCDIFTKIVMKLQLCVCSAFLHPQNQLLRPFLAMPMCDIMWVKMYTQSHLKCSMVIGSQYCLLRLNFPIFASVVKNSKFSIQFTLLNFLFKSEVSS